MEAKLTKHVLINGLRDVSNLSQLARKLGVDRSTIYRNAKRMGIELICGRHESQHIELPGDETVAINDKPLPPRQLRRDSPYSGRCLGDVGRRR